MEFVANLYTLSKDNFHMKSVVVILCCGFDLRRFLGSLLHCNVCGGISILVRVLSLIVGFFRGVFTWV